MTDDVIVVGAGVIGLATAFELASHGARVRVMERGRVGAEASTAAAGMLLPPPPPPENEDRSPEAAFLGLLRSSHRLIPEWVMAVNEASGRKVDWALDGLAFVADTAEEADRLRRRVAADPSARLLDAAEFEERVPGGRGRERAWFSSAGWIDNQALLPALARAAESRGVEIREGVSVERVEVEGDRVVGVRSGGYRVDGSCVLLAAGAWSDRLLPGGAARPGVRPVRGAILALEPPEPRAPVALTGESHYLIPRRDGSFLAGSTLEDAGYEKTVTEDAIRSVLSGVGALLSGAHRWTIRDRWAGLRPRSTDGLPVIGPAGPAGLWLATGHYREGILGAAATARELGRAILEGRPPDEIAPLGIDRFQIEEPLSTEAGS